MDKRDLNIPIKRDLDITMRKNITPLSEIVRRNPHSLLTPQFKGFNFLYILSFIIAIALFVIIILLAVMPKVIAVE